MGRNHVNAGGKTPAQAWNEGIAEPDSRKVEILDASDEAADLVLRRKESGERIGEWG